MLAWYLPGVKPRTWRQARATVTKVETDSDNCMLVSVAYPAETLDAGAVTDRSATIYFNESLSTIMFSKQADRIRHHYDMQSIDVWYALEVPDECHRFKPNNVTRTVGALIGTAVALGMALGSSYYVLPLLLAR